MEILNTLFTSLADFAGYAPGIDTNYTLDDLKAAALTTRKQMEAILSKDVLEAVIDSQDQALTVPLKTAVANRTMAGNAVFAAYQQRKAGTDVYKYEMEQMRRSYMENYYNAMDSLLDIICHLVDEDPIATAWHASPYGQLLGQCRITSPMQFDMTYNIDGSALFFFRTLPIQKEVTDSCLGTYYDKAQDNSRVTGMLNLALCKKVVATALRRFDILECPATVRNLFDDSKVSGQRKDERQQADLLADRLDGEADALIDTIDTLLTADTTPDISSYSAFNREDDNIVMMP